MKPEQLNSLKKMFQGGEDDKILAKGIVSNELDKIYKRVKKQVTILEELLPEEREYIEKVYEIRIFDKNDNFIGRDSRKGFSVEEAWSGYLKTRFEPAILDSKSYPRKYKIS